MGADLLAWMRSQADSRSNYPLVAEQIEEAFPQFEDLDDLFEQMEELINQYENGTDEQRMTRTIVANVQRPAAREAIREWFLAIRRDERHRAYADFSKDIVQPGDCLLTFNYDVSLDRRLKEAGKWHVGDGYGFTIEGLPGGSPTRLLKLHGSTNWLALMDGLPIRGPAQVSCAFASPRPAIGTRELDFLGYVGQRDVIFPDKSAALPAMITGRNKKFSFDTSFGDEFAEFWRGLWQQAKAALARAECIVICGYSVPAVDEAACDLLLNAPQRDAKVLVLCGKRRTDEIIAEYKKRGFKSVRAADQCRFEDWVSRSLQRMAAPATSD
jgi:hypothetical protein